MSSIELAPLIVAFEGPSLAGKSTTIDAVQKCERTFTCEVVPEFSDFVGRGTLLPPLMPSSTEDRLRAVKELAAIDERRCAAALKSRADVVILDRSLHSVLAISYALEKVIDLPVFDATRTLLQPSATLWPDLVFFLLTPQEVRVSRSPEGVDESDNPHVTGPIQTRVHEYFQILSRRVPVTFLRTDGPLEKVAARACEVIERRRQPPGGARSGSRVEVSVGSR